MPDTNMLKSVFYPWFLAFRACSPWVRYSVYGHGVLLLMWGLGVPWPWLIGLLFVIHGVLVAAGLLPRSALLGKNMVRLPGPNRAQRQLALTFDDGPDPTVTPIVLDILRSHGVKATFFCIGERALAHPSLCQRIVTEGHALENHGQAHHVLTSFYGLRGWYREIRQGQGTLACFSGRTPRFYRAVAGLRNPFLDPVLTHLGVRLVSWTRRAYDTRCNDSELVFQRLIKNLGPGDILLLHDGHSAKDQFGRPVVLDVLPKLLIEIAGRGLVPITLDEVCLPN